MKNSYIINYKEFNFLNKKNSKKYSNLIKKINFLLEKKNGFVVIKNFKINRENLKKTNSKYINFLKNFGTLLSQNKKKEKITKVIDKGKKWSANNRGYITNDYIPFHTDGGTIASLLCVNNSSKGGQSIVTESKNIYISLKKNYPNLLKILED